ncbi:arginase family protein [Blautia liquoris]|jgi:arginase family enzyme|uniref:Arginase family protein n=1 Tax=Blautia liquoris TaxID=2779518 RepID=A0A7M2RHS6_9FIRM|nr:arginase family protein [Blautia liquoris]QOV19886.1 arginase family protein [Blautia liquoris]
MKSENLVFNFRHSYSEKLKEEKDLTWVECSDIQECVRYCSARAKKQLKKKIDQFDISGIHFIDSGDYHYMTKFITDRITEPFSLVLIDHHTDMQKPIVKGFTSCGNWAWGVLEENLHLVQLILIGQDQRFIDELDLSNADNKEKVLVISEEQLGHGNAKDIFAGIQKGIPLYLSIDKDVLSKKEALTNWDQGNMSVSYLKQLIRFFFFKWDVIGIDLGGEVPNAFIKAEFDKERRINGRLNQELYSYIIECSERRRPPVL